MRETRVACSGSLAQGVMNQNNRDRKRTAREQLREQQAREKAAEKRGRVLKVTAVIVAVLVVAAVVGVLVSQQGGDKAASKPVTVGKKSAPVKLTVYEDFRCPACGQFENQFRSTVRGLEKQGKLRTDYHLVTIIDNNMQGTGSKRAANAAMCAQDEGRFAEYHDVLFENQPEEKNDAFADNELLLKLAKKAGGLESAKFEKCVRDGGHDEQVKQSDEAFKDSGHSSTPTVLLDGKTVYGQGTEPLTPEKLKKKVEAAA